MQEIEITKRKFNSYKKIINGIVHCDENNIYKYSPTSWPIMTIIENNIDKEYFKNIATPKAYLICQKKFFGFVMDYNKTIIKISEAIKANRIENINKYIEKLLNIIEELNKIGIYYWDFHSGNIMVDENGNPFVLDIDGAEYIPEIDYLHSQREYLTEFLINIYLGKDDLFFIHKPKWEWIGHKYMSKKSQDYINVLGNLCKPAPELPYCILEDFKDEEKLMLIKSQLNN